MALLSELTSDQLEAIRSNNHYRALQFVCLVPNNVVVQFQPDAAPTTPVYAEITIGSIIEGDPEDTKQGQLVIYSTTADYRATETFRTRVRIGSESDVLSVGENSQTLDDTMYVTVIDTYEVQEKLRKDTTHVDWSITFRKLLPIETALPTAVVLTNDETEFSPVANAIPMDASATTISTHAWESSNPNDTLDSGGSTNNPTFTLEAGAFRWIRYAFSDDNGLLNYRVIAVWTVPRTYESVVALGFIGESGDVADIASDPELGWSATVPAWTGITNVLNHTFCVIACDEWYNDERQSIRTNINMVGYLQNEDTQTSGSEQHGKISETRFTVEGFGHQLARQNVSTLTVIRTAGTPIAWDQIQNPTPGRMLTYRLSEYSTILNLCALTIPADDTDFVSDDLTLSNGKALDDIRTIAEGINAELQYDVDGKLDLCRNLNFGDDTARDNADVVATLSPSDFNGTFSFDTDYSKTTSAVNMTGGAYNSTADVYDLYEADSPAVARRGEGDPLPIGNQVLLTDSTPQEAQDEIAQRAANYDAANNPTWTLRGTLNDEWHFLVPDIGSWFKFTIGVNDTARGTAFGASDRWQLVQISISTNSETGRRQPDCVWRHETRSTGAMVRAAPIINDTDDDIIYYPAVLPPYTGETLEFTDGNWYDSQDVAPPGDGDPPDAECEVGGLRIKNPVAFQTDGSAGNGELVVVTTRGKGRIGYGAWEETFDFTVSDADFEVVPIAPYGQYSGGTGWICTYDNDPTFGFSNRCVIRRIFDDEFTITSWALTYVATAVGAGNGLIIQGLLAGVPVFTENFGGMNPDGNPHEFVHTGTHTIDELRMSGETAVTGAEDTDAMMFKSVHIEGIGLNPVGENTEIMGDSYYTFTGSLESPVNPTPYDAGEGLLIESSQPDAIPPFSPTGEYTVYQVVTSGPVSLDFDSPHPLSEASNWSIQAIICFTGIFP